MNSLEKEVRRKIVEVSKRMYQRGLVSGAGGNVSARIAGSGYVLVTPSGVCKGFLKPSEIVKINLDGKVIEGSLKPTSETPMHTEIYKVREGVNAIVHAHPPFSTSFACANVSFNVPMFPEIIATVGEIGIVKYVTPSTMELAKEVSEAAKKYDALLLENHGTITLGTSLEQAYQRAEVLEDYAKVLLFSILLGGPRALSEEEAKKIRGLDAEKYRIEYVEKLK